MTVSYKDYYQTLGVDKKSSPDDIKKAFRKLARLYHPDVAKDKKTAETKFKEINEAYEVLSDTTKREKYDSLGPNWQQAQSNNQGFPGSNAQSRQWRPGPGGPANPMGSGVEFEGTGFSEFFEELFGSRSGRGRGGFNGGFSSPGNHQSHSENVNGQDLETDLLVTLEDLIISGTKPISLRITGDKRDETKSYNVKIPRGIREGQRIRLPGQGGSAQGKGQPGDLFLRIKIARHPDFTLEGDHLKYELELTPWEAIFGCQLTLPLLANPVSLKIPAGTQSGKKLRLRGMGLPKANNENGDLFVDIQVQVPAEVSAEEKELWEKISKTSKFNPRD